MHKTHLENLKPVWQRVHPSIIIHSSVIHDSSSSLSSSICLSIHHPSSCHSYLPSIHPSISRLSHIQLANCFLFRPSSIVLLTSSGSSGSFVTLCQFLTQTVFFGPEPPVTRQSDGGTGKHMRLNPEQRVEGKSLGHFRSSAGHSLVSDAFI